MTHSENELAAIYDQRFKGKQNYRNRVWRVLIDDFIQTYVPPDAAVLDIGCGYGEFINNVRCRTKFGMDMNPNTAKLIVSRMFNFCSRIVPPLGIFPRPRWT